MGWAFYRMVAVVGAISLVFQLMVAGWDNRRKGLGRTYLSFWQVLGEWAGYVVIFIMLSMLLDAILPSELYLVRSMRGP